VPAAAWRSPARCEIRITGCPEGDNNTQGDLDGEHIESPLLLGRPAASRSTAERGRAHAARCRARLLSGAFAATCAGCVSPRAHRSGDLPRNGRDGPAWGNDSGRVWRRRPQLRQLWSGSPRGRTRRFRLSFDDERPVVPGDGADPRLRQRGAESQVPAPPGEWRIDWLLRPHRSEPRFRPRRHGQQGARSAWRLSLVGQQDVDHQLANRRRLPTSSSSGPRTMAARFAASSSTRECKVCLRRPSTAR